MLQVSLVSIIIPTYNRAHLISETLDSVLSQDYKNWECIVVDDGSTDNTKDLLKTYETKDPRFKYLQRSDKHLPGGNGARNCGFKKSTGDYLVFLDSDDVLMPFAISQRIKTMTSISTDMAISQSGVFENVVGDTDRVWNKFTNTTSITDFLIRFFNIDMPWQTAGVTWSRYFFESCGMWNEDLTAWQDWELHCKALLNNPKLNVTSSELDNYYRYFTNDGIANSYKSKSYLQAMGKAIISVYKVLIENRHIFKTVKPYYKILIFCMLIKRPITLGYKWFSLKYLFRFPFFKDISRLKFFKIYVVELLGSSTKIRTFILGSHYKKQQKYFQMQTSHLK